MRPVEYGAVGRLALQSPPPRCSSGSSGLPMKVVKTHGASKIQKTIQTVLSSNYSRIHPQATIEKLADNEMKIEILHNVFGSITVDDEGNISVRKPDLAERLTWLLKHEDELDGLAHYHTGLNGRLIAVMEYPGIAGLPRDRYYGLSEKQRQAGSRAADR